MWRLDNKPTKYYISIIIIFKGTDDPFGEDFEESLKSAPKIPVKRVSFNLIW